MSDLFHEEVPDDFVDGVFETMRAATWHQFQVLTKRADRMADYLMRRRLRWGSFSEQSPHVWLGTSVENQDYLARAELVAHIDASVRFLSCEPLLGRLDLRGVLGAHAINWVIVGGESGWRARPMKTEWVISIREQCRAAGVAFFFKQWGGRNKKAAGRTLEAKTWDEFPEAVAADG